MAGLIITLSFYRVGSAFPVLAILAWSAGFTFDSFSTLRFLSAGGNERNFVFNSANKFLTPHESLVVVLVLEVCAIGAIYLMLNIFLFPTTVFPVLIGFGLVHLVAGTVNLL